VLLILLLLSTTKKEFGESIVRHLFTILDEFLPLQFQIIAAVILILLVVRVDLIDRGPFLRQDISSSSCFHPFDHFLPSVLLVRHQKLLIGYSFINCKPFLLLRSEIFDLVLHFFEILFESCIERLHDQGLLMSFL